jgi:pyruvate/2-oxoglutarate dehydrogenase complex dihydrolipoamide acyltransferase (E2) component
LESTKQKIDQLEHQLTYLQIVAPFDGVIDAVLMHEGDLAAVGKPILRMSNGKKKLVFTYSPVKNDMIGKEQDVFFHGETIGYVKTIYTVSQNGLTAAEVTLNKTLSAPTGASVNIEVLTKEKEGCLLPDNTLLHKKEGTYVMQYDQGRFVPTKVHVALQDENTVMVSPCPAVPVAQASEVKLSQLPSYGNVTIAGAK